jgi:protein SCO1/2
MSRLSTRRFAAALILLIAPALLNAGPVPSNSLYQLAIPLTTQDGHAATLDLDRGHPVLITMFYASCPAICPTLIEHIKILQQSLPPEQRAKLRVLMVSLDPARDTPAALAALAKKHRVDLTYWTFARASAADVRALAAALGIQYRQLPDGDFDHSTVISLLDGEGRIVARNTSLATTDADLAAPLRQLLTAP